MERLARDKHSSLLQTFVNYDGRSFLTLGLGIVPMKPSNEKRFSNLDVRIVGVELTGGLLRPIALFSCFMTKKKEIIGENLSPLNHMNPYSQQFLFFISYELTQ
jgi:hypothetical protein